MTEEQQRRDLVEPRQLKDDSRFAFRCYKEIPCFTKCCSNIKSILTPYDIVRMKKKLNMTSDEFLAKHTVPQYYEEMPLPMVTLKMEENDEKSCPFVTGKGCAIYEDRPATCRYYPVGLAALNSVGHGQKEQFYFLLREEHCLGFEENREWTVQRWRENEEVDRYDRMNSDWTEIVSKAKSMEGLKASEKSLELFYMVSYDLDRFRRFVFESPFLKSYDIPAEQIESIREDDEELMLFGLRWLKMVLLGEGDIS